MDQTCKESCAHKRRRGVEEAHIIWFVNSPLEQVRAATVGNNVEDVDDITCCTRNRPEHCQAGHVLTTNTLHACCSNAWVVQLMYCVVQLLDGIIRVLHVIYSSHWLFLCIGPHPGWPPLDRNLACLGSCAEHPVASTK